MSSPPYLDSPTTPEWSTWLPDGHAANDILSSRMDMANIFLQSEAALPASSCRSPSIDKIQRGEGRATLTSLRDMERRYSSGVKDLYHSTTYAVEAAVYFSVLEAIACGALIRFHGITKTGQAVSNLLAGRLESLGSLAKDRAARFLIFRGVETIYQLAQTTGATYLVDRICANALVRVLYGSTERVFGDDYIYRLAWKLLRTALFLMAVFQVLVLECGARVTWIIICSVFKCFLGTRQKAEPRDGQPPESWEKGEELESSTIFNDILVCLLCLVSIPVGFASFYFQLEAFDSTPDASIKDDRDPSPQKALKKKKNRVKTHESLVKATKPDAETLPDVCPIVMEPLDGDETKNGEATEGGDVSLELKATEDPCHYDQYADELEALMRAGRSPWNVESSPEEDSVIINTDQDAHHVQPAFLAGRFPASTTSPVPDMNSLVGLNILLGLIQIHMAANGNAAVESTTLATNKKSISLDEDPPVGGGPFPDDQNTDNKCPKKVASTIASTTSSPLKNINTERGENAIKQYSTSPQSHIVEHDPVRSMTGLVPVQNEEPISSRPDSTEKIKPEQPGLLQHCERSDSMTEVSQMLLERTGESPFRATSSVTQCESVPESKSAHSPISTMQSPSSEGQKASTQPPNTITISEISRHKPNDQVLHPDNRRHFISETSSATTVTSGTTTMVSSDALSPSPSSSSLRSVTTALKKLTLAATAPPFIPKRTLSMSIATQPLPLGVGMANRPPPDLWSPAPKVAINICPPPPKKRRVRGRGRKALEAVASAAMNSINNENSAPASRTMDINL